MAFVLSHSGRPAYSEEQVAYAVRLMRQGFDVADVRRHLFQRFGVMPDAATIRKWWTERGASS